VSPEDVAAVLADLAAGPPGLARAIHRLPPHVLDFRGLGGRSPREIVAHLADLEFNVHWPEWVARILFEEEPRLEPPWTDRRARGHRYQDPQVALGVYTLARRHVVAVLSDAPAAAWDRVGVHPTAGPRPLIAFARAFVEHDRRHVAQIRELAALAGGDTAR
jgi:hypothetical protein